MSIRQALRGDGDYPLSLDGRGIESDPYSVTEARMIHTAHKNPNTVQAATSMTDSKTNVCCNSANGVHQENAHNRRTERRGQDHFGDAEQSEQNPKRRGGSSTNRPRRCAQDECGKSAGLVQKKSIGAEFVSLERIMLDQAWQGAVGY